MNLVHEDETCNHLSQGVPLQLALWSIYGAIVVTFAALVDLPARIQTCIRFLISTGSYAHEVTAHMHTTFLIILWYEVYLMKEVFKGSKLAHGYSHLTHVIGYITRASGPNRERVNKGLLQSFHPLRQSIFCLLRRLLQITYTHQLQICQRLQMVPKYL